MLLNLLRDSIPVWGQMEILWHCHSDALQVVIQRVRVVDDFTDIIKATQCILEGLQCSQRRLGGG